MRRADAPSPGWYPDPAGDHRLRWWDGLDWTDHRRVRPPQGHDAGDVGRAAAAAAAADAGGSGDRGGGRGGPPSTSAGLRAAGVRTAASSSDQTAQVLAEARKVAREEVDRAVRDVRQQVDQARGRYEPMVREWLDRGRRWLRTIAIAVTIVLVLGFLLQAMTQATLLDWLGERIDAVTSTTSTPRVVLPVV